MMRYKSFEIRNFRGIRHARVELSPSGAGIFTLIGLNESGKTTILEAISSFSLAQGDERSLYSVDASEEDPASFVPKHEKYNFTGDVCVTATIVFEGSEKDQCKEWAESEGNWKIDGSFIGDEFTIRRGKSYVNSDMTESINEWSVDLRGFEGRGRTIKSVPASDSAWRKFVAMVSAFLPEIVYFPTFLFSQPEKIVLNPIEDEESDIDRIYRKIIENVGDSLPKPINMMTHIVERIVQSDTPVEQFVGLFGLSQNKQQQVDSAIDELSHRLTETVFDSWSKVFGRSFSDREVRLKLGVDKHDDDSPRVYLQIGLRDGRQQYDISERSLGFRWFFSFLLFTLFRTRENQLKPTLFLLDEPASNLHSSAQTQLMESFPRIAAGKNMLMYSTHTLASLQSELSGKAIESFLDDADRQAISTHFGIQGSPTKSQIQLFFSEKLAAKEHVELSGAFRSRILAFDLHVKRSLALPVSG